MDPVTCMLPVMLRSCRSLHGLSPSRGLCCSSLLLALSLLQAGVPATPGALTPNFEFLRSWPLSSQVISKKTPKKIAGYLLSSLSLALLIWLLPGFPLLQDTCSPFSLIDGSSLVEALPLSLFRGTCYPSLSLALSIPLVPDLSLPLEPRILGLWVLRCRLASISAAIVSSAVFSSLSLPCCQLAIEVSMIEVKC